MGHERAAGRHGIWGLFLAYFIPVLLIGSLLFAFLLVEEDEHFRELIAANEQLQLKLAARSITRDLESVIPDIDLLINSSSLDTFAYSHSDISRDLLLEEWLTFMRQKRFYSVIRLIDSDGQERLRVDRYNGSLRVLEDEELQNKAKRYYFTEAMKLEEGELYISPIDLEVEHGEIVTPHIPMLRFAMPLLNSKGERVAIFVISYMAQRMIENFDEMLGGSSGHISLLNGDGYWLRDPQHPEREWGFMFGNDWRYDKVHPVVWSDIAAADHGQVERDGSLFSFLTLFPLEIAGGYKAEDDGNSHGHFHVDPRSYRLKIVSDVEPRVLHQALYENLYGVPLLVWVLSMMLSALVAWLLAGMQLERRRLHRQLALDALVVEATTDGVFITDAERVILSVNEGFSQITGYSADEAIGRSPASLTAGTHAAEVQEAIWRALEDEGSWQGEVENRRKDGGLYHEWLSLRTVRDERGALHNYVGIFSDITAKKNAELALHHQAHHDALTGLPNRLLMEDRLQQVLAHCRRSSGRAALLFIDLDRFKPINDEHGHEAGDAVLREVARRLSAVLREEDTVARIGGDEFVAIVGDGRSIDNLRGLAQRLVDELRRPYELEELSCRISASVGVALFPDHAEDGASLLKRADEAMYQIKEEGRDGVAFYQPSE